MSTTRDRILEAIRRRRMLELVYDGGRRIVEPYLLFESKDGDELLHGWQTEGSWSDKPPPKWFNLKLTGIASVTPLDSYFSQPHQGYNPFSSQFHRVIACTAPAAKPLAARSAPGS